MSISKISVFKFSTFLDHRGGISFCNEFDFSPFKRFYKISSGKIGQVRAWQGHLYEEKVFLPLKGKIKIVGVPIFNLESENFGNPEEYLLDAKSPELIHLPGGYVNGFQFLDDDAEILVFSNFSLEESRNDDFRFEVSRFYRW